jgi:hypothetical protein
MITAHGMRVYLACFALVAIREAAARSRRKRSDTSRDPSRYRVDELERLTKLDGSKVRRALRELRSAQLVTFAEGRIHIEKHPLSGSEDFLETLSGRRSPQRPIPVPRALLRFLAQHRSEALTKVTLAYLARGLSIARRTGEICAKGTVKASWIAENFGLSRRAVKYAQAELRELGWITKDTRSHQLKLNRDGAYFVINLNWNFEARATNIEKTNSAGAPAAVTVIVERDKSRSNPAPLRPQTAPVFAPPKEDKETSNEDQHQETRAAEPSAGVFPEGEGTPSAHPPRPTLQDVRADDLTRLSRLEELHHQAVTAGWIPASEAMALNFVAASVRAREVGHEPVRIFVTLVR